MTDRQYFTELEDLIVRVVKLFYYYTKYYKKDPKLERKAYKRLCIAVVYLSEHLLLLQTRYQKGGTIYEE